MGHWFVVDSSVESCSVDGRTKESLASFSAASRCRAIFARPLESAHGGQSVCPGISCITIASLFFFGADYQTNLVVLKPTRPKHRGTIPRVPGVTLLHHDTTFHALKTRSWRFQIVLRQSRSDGRMATRHISVYRFVQRRFTFKPGDQRTWRQGGQWEIGITEGGCCRTWISFFFRLFFSEVIVGLGL